MTNSVSRKVSLQLITLKPTAKWRPSIRLLSNELPKVLWAYRTTSRTSTGETPFSMAYRIEVMIPVEVGLPSLWRETYDLEENHAFQCYELDLLEKKRDLTALRIASYRRQSERYLNSKFKEKGLKKATLFYERFCLTLRRSMLEYLGLIGKGLTS